MEARGNRLRYWGTNALSSQRVEGSTALLGVWERCQNGHTPARQARFERGVVRQAAGFPCGPAEQVNWLFNLV